ncbi:hypothetical protein K2X05_14135 [bacterium]|nr:hypothetical protein [bacterium]
MRILASLILTLLTSQLSWAADNPTEIYCLIRSSGGNLSCQLMGKDRKIMSPEDITNFIDAAEVKAYITLKSRKGFERTYEIDGKAAQFKRLADIKKSASISEIARAKSELFSEIEKKVIKIADEQDGQRAAAELVFSDSHLTYDKLKKEQRDLTNEVEGYRKNREKICTTTPEFENMSKVNARLQQTLSNLIYAFQTPDTCMAGYKVFKDKNGSVDLRQLDSASDHFKSNCKTTK